MTATPGSSRFTGDTEQDNLLPLSIDKAVKQLSKVENRGFTNDIPDKNTLVLAGLLGITFKNLSSCVELSLRELHCEPFALAALHTVDGVALGRGSFTSKTEQELNACFKKTAHILKRGINKFLSDPDHSPRKGRALLNDLEAGAKLIVSQALIMRSLPEDLNKGRFPNDLKQHTSQFDELKALSLELESDGAGEPGSFQILAHSVGAAYELMVHSVAHGERGRGMRGRKFRLAAAEHLNTFADATIHVPAKIGFEPIQKLNEVVKALEDSHEASKDKFYEEAKEKLVKANESCDEFIQLLSELAEAA